MKNKIFVLLFLSTFLSSFQVTQAQKPKLVNRTREGIIKYLNTLIKDSCVAVGQHCQDGINTPIGYNMYIEGLKKNSGKYPMLIEVEYGYTAHNNLDLINTFVAKQWNRGGLVSISWHADNPWEDGYNCRFNSRTNKDIIDFNKIIKSAPESSVKASYRKELMNVGMAIKKLQDEGITVLFRPFHEMNGFWFWWGANDKDNPTNVQSFRALWKDIYDTFTVDLGLHNIVWIYGPNATNNTTAPIDAMYPGDEMVDVVGLDIYTSKPNIKKEDYSILKMYRKPIVVAEVGTTREDYGKLDELQMAKDLRGKAAYFSQWNGGVTAKIGIIDNLNFQELMNAPFAIVIP